MALSLPRGWGRQQSPCPDLLVRPDSGLDFLSSLVPYPLPPTATGGDYTDLWQTDILAALEADAEGLGVAQSEIAKWR